MQAHKILFFGVSEEVHQVRSPIIKPISPDLDHKQSSSCVLTQLRYLPAGVLRNARLGEKRPPPRPEFPPFFEPVFLLFSLQSCPGGQESGPSSQGVPSGCAERRRPAAPAGGSCDVRHPHDTKPRHVGRRRELLFCFVVAWSSNARALVVTVVCVRTHVIKRTWEHLRPCSN